MKTGYFVRCHGQHGFSSNGIVFRTLAEATAEARRALEINSSLLGCEIKPRDGSPNIRILRIEDEVAAMREP